MFSTLSVLFRPMYGNPDSGIRKILACGIRKAGSVIPLTIGYCLGLPLIHGVNCPVLQDFSLCSRQRLFQLSAQYMKHWWFFFWYSHGLLTSFNKDTVRRNQKLVTIATLQTNYLANYHLTAVSFDCFYQLRRLFDSLDKNPASCIHYLSKWIQNILGFWIPRHGFRILDHFTFPWNYPPTPPLNQH